ncbi:MAG: UbiH/UbiF/VisC/COQ6 family ubiquinone biosynthesis hydroxylase [Candidatus Berkiella sp.]
MRFDVIIVGAGVVGLTCVLALAQKGFKVALVEAQPHPPKPLPQHTDAYDNRVFAISRASQQLFESLGVFSIIQSSRCSAYQHMKVWDEVMDGKIDFNAMDYFESDLGHIIEQKVILGSLWQKLATQTVTYFWGKTPKSYHVDDCQIELILSCEARLNASLVIAADGGNSLMRSLSEIPTKGWDYAQKALVATVKGSCSHQQTAFQRFAKSGSLALLPLCDPFHSSIVWATSPFDADLLCQLPENEFNSILTREINAVMGDLELVGQRFSFELRTHHVKHYAASRCVLVGDAAHTLHPLAGQGVNLGLLDVSELVKQLSRAKSATRDIGSLTVLSRYERRRKWHNQAMIWSMELFKQGFASQNNVVQLLRNKALSFVDRQKSIKQIFTKLAMGTF